MSDSNSSRCESPLWPAVIVFVVALALRLDFLFEFAGLPLFDLPIMEMADHHRWAQDIVAGRGAEYIPFFRAPLYAYFLAGVYATLGDGAWPIRIVQAVLGSLSPVFVLLFGWRVFGRRTGMLAGLVTAIWGTLIFYDGQLLAAGLAVCLSLASLYFLVRALDRHRWADLTYGGLLLGLAAMTRPAILPFAACVVLWLLWKTIRRQGRLNAGKWLAFMLAILVPIAPMAVANYAASGDLKSLGTGVGLNFHIANHAESDGLSVTLPGARRDARGMIKDAQTWAQRRTGKRLGAGEVSVYWLRRGLHEISADPERWLKHLLRKAIILVQGVEFSNNFDLYYFAHRTTVLRVLLWSAVIFAPWGLILPLAAYGMLVGLRSDERSRLLTLFVVTTGAVMILFFVTSLYRLPLAPVLALFAVHGALTVWVRLRSRAHGKWLTAALVVIPLAVVANWDFLGHAPRSNAAGLFTLATLHAQRGEFRQSESSYREAIDADSSLVAAYNDLGALLMSQGEFREAIDVLLAGLHQAPEDPLLHRNLGEAYLALGQMTYAIMAFQRPVALAPEDPAARYNLASAHYMAGQYDSAAVHFRHLLTSDPEHEDARLGLAVTFVALNLGDSAVVHLEYYANGADTTAPDFNRGAIRLLDSLRQSRTP